MKRYLLCIFASLTMLAGAANAQVVLGPNGPENAEAKIPAPALDGTPSRAPDRAKVFELRLHPAAEPAPALKHHLIPQYLERKPGNAAPYYYRAILAYKGVQTQLKDQKLWEDYERWIETPLKELPRQEIRGRLRHFHRAFENLEIAAYREHCEWDWRLQDLQGNDVIAFLLEEIQESRGLARLLSLKVRLQIAEKKYEEAILTIRTGYQFARDVAKPRTLINSLVGIAIVELLNEQLRELMTAPESPNLYWALAEVADSYIDMLPAMSHEMSTPLLMYPFLKDAETAQRTPEQWRQLMTEMVSEISNLSGDGLLKGGAKQSNLLAAAAVTAMMLKDYSRVKKELIDSGVSRERLENMPVAQAVAIHQRRTYQYMYHEVFKWQMAPYHLARKHAEASMERLRKQGYFSPGGKGEVFPLCQLLLPAAMNARYAEVRLNARIAALQIVEAIRAHAANHDGQLPKTLVDIELPVRNNPLTGKPFPYRLEGETAVLEAPQGEGGSPENLWRLKMTIVK